MKQIARIAIGIWILTAVYFFYQGVTTVASEGDSIMYHLPIARSVIDGTVFTGSRYFDAYAYYPGTGETIVAVMMALGLPLNLFNWLGWVLLFWVTRVFGMNRGLSGELATVTAVAVTMLPTAVRLFPTQLVDIWMAVWWGWGMIKSEKIRSGKAKLGDWVLWGVILGLLVGTKFSGLMYAVILIVWCGKQIWSAGIKKALGWVIPAALIGGWWYIRNWILKGNPMYPLDFLWWQGEPSARLPIVWKTLLEIRGITFFAGSLVSEFLLGAGLLLLPLWRRNGWVWVGMAVVLVFAVLPGGVPTILSNCRYLMPAMLVLAVEAARWAQEKRKEEWMGTLAVLNSVMVLPQLEYKPKLLLLTGIGWGIWLWKKSVKK